MRRIRFGPWPKAWQAKLDRMLLDAVCRRRHVQVDCLLVLGADPDVTGWCDLGLVSALSAACIQEDASQVWLLLRYGANPDGNPIEPMSPYERVSDEYASDATRSFALALESRFT
jgi:hypothetical protein